MALSIGVVCAGTAFWYMECEEQSTTRLRVSAGAYRRCRALLDTAEERGLIMGFYRDGRIIRVDEALWGKLSKTERRSILVAENCVAFGTAWPQRADQSISAISDINGRMLDQITAAAR